MNARELSSGLLNVLSDGSIAKIEVKHNKLIIFDSSLFHKKDIILSFNNKAILKPDAVYYFSLAELSQHELMLTVNEQRSSHSTVAIIDLNQACCLKVTTFNEVIMSVQSVDERNALAFPSSSVCLHILSFSDDEPEIRLIHNVHSRHSGFISAVLPFDNKSFFFGILNKAQQTSCVASNNIETPPQYIPININGFIRSMQLLDGQRMVLLGEHMIEGPFLLVKNVVSGKHELEKSIGPHYFNQLCLLTTLDKPYIVAIGKDKDKQEITHVNLFDSSTLEKIKGFTIDDCVEIKPVPDGRLACLNNKAEINFYQMPIITAFHKQTQATLEDCGVPLEVTKLVSQYAGFFYGSSKSLEFKEEQRVQEDQQTARCIIS